MHFCKTGCVCQDWANLCDKFYGKFVCGGFNYFGNLLNLPPCADLFVMQI
ncbi:hypothetical protein CAMRE0001_0661 [Campylobacter rectus RM3267]|uniref:Uncharacterized protein n=1 Tax=Campylobacter rectus RM3267 TaxID=553218 RepID=B9D1J7_CAMRE|nr:hypothetical protein CAMRE0001_0661 [Campylobacter rectus RM3267]